MKKYIIILTIGILGVTLTAFSDFTQKKEHEENPVWWQLIPYGNPASRYDYEFAGDQPCYGSSFEVCGVFAPEDMQYPGYPDLSGYIVYVYKHL